MTGTGIVRRIDPLGRVVIPKELRQVLRVRTGDQFEIYTGDSGEIILKKFSMLNETGLIAAQYAAVLHHVSGYPSLICDCDQFIAAVGIPQKEMVGQKIPPALGEIITNRISFWKGQVYRSKLKPLQGLEQNVIAGAAIFGSNDVYGAVVLLEKDDGSSVG